MCAGFVVSVTNCVDVTEEEGVCEDDQLLG
jgi:hypothetical protein